MSNISEVIEVWMKVQSKWMYLEAIFVGSEDIRLQLPEEAKRFDRIHGAFKKIMERDAEEPERPRRVHGGRAETTTLLHELFSELEACQKSLSDYLETKRCSFPRFYFLSDDELLQILGTSDPMAVQEHMLKLFDNTAALTFDRGGTKVLGMVSSEKETFPFETHLQATEGAGRDVARRRRGRDGVDAAHDPQGRHLPLPDAERVDWVKRQRRHGRQHRRADLVDLRDDRRLQPRARGRQDGMKNFAHKNHRCSTT